MCFSAKASFTAAALLGIIGALTITKVKRPPQWMLALIPLLFAIQQASEGLLWVSLDNTDWLHLVNRWKSTFLFFALVVWPFWVPLSVHMLEENQQRKRWLYALAALGCIFAIAMLVNLYVRWPSDAITVQIVGDSIQYGLPTDHLMEYGIFYYFITLLPPIISSYPGLWVVGIINLAAFALASFLYNATFISVWCFFAALVSISIFFILKNQPNER